MHEERLEALSDFMQQVKDFRNKGNNISVSYSAQSMVRLQEVINCLSEIEEELQVYVSAKCSNEGRAPADGHLQAALEGPRVSQLLKDLQGSLNACNIDLQLASSEKDYLKQVSKLIPA
ncbi:hypothetical protein FGO68_gene12828 [Halteria grandinella]|uniref:Uncharacterized protein n=1 Tax=Halteria grandinella TaxID=5974 RepID=A0A8J8P1V2_HALGN|nr:hypothetical protein FGO68_gene12828 [Halteria grandinella]